MQKLTECSPISNQPARASRVGVIDRNASHWITLSETRSEQDRRVCRRNLLRRQSIRIVMFARRELTLSSHEERLQSSQAKRLRGMLKHKLLLIFTSNFTILCSSHGQHEHFVRVSRIRKRFLDHQRPRAKKARDCTISSKVHKSFSRNLDITGLVNKPN